MRSIGRAIVWGATALKRFAGLWAMLFALQTAFAAFAGAIAAQILSAAFPNSYLLELATRGDILAFSLARDARPGIAESLLWLGAFTTAIYSAISWFLHAGLVSVLISRKTGGRSSRFGIGAAKFGPRFALLTFLTLPLWGLCYWVWQLGTIVFSSHIDSAMHWKYYLLWQLAAASPSLLLALVITTIVNYARVQIVAADETGVLIALGHGARFVFSTPATLVHASLYPLTWLAVGSAYLFLTWEAPLVGASTALSILGLRIATNALRFTTKAMVLAGQVEWIALREEDAHKEIRSN